MSANSHTDPDDIRDRAMEQALKALTKDFAISITADLDVVVRDLQRLKADVSSATPDSSVAFVSDLDFGSIIHVNVPGRIGGILKRLQQIAEVASLHEEVRCSVDDSVR